MKFLTIAVLLLGALGCGGGSNSAPVNNAPAPTTITAVPAGPIAFPGTGATADVTVTVYDQFGHILTGQSFLHYSSSNPGVAAVCNDALTNPDVATICTYASGDATIFADDAKAKELEISVSVHN